MRTSSQKCQLTYSPAFSGSNLQALIDSTRDPKSSSQIVLVISNKAAVAGLDLAERAGIPTRVSDCRRGLPAGMAWWASA